MGIPFVVCVAIIVVVAGVGRVKVTAFLSCVCVVVVTHSNRVRLQKTYISFVNNVSATFWLRFRVMIS